MVELMFTAAELRQMIEACLQVYAQNLSGVVKLGDCLIRQSNQQPELDEISYYCPIGLLNFYNNYTASQLAIFMDYCVAEKIDYRVNCCMYYPDPAVKPDTALDYHLIELRDWPALKVVPNFKNNQNNFNRLRNQIVNEPMTKVRPSSKLEVQASFAKILTYPDFTTLDLIYAWLTSPRFAQLAWFTVESMHQLSCHLTAIEQKTMWSFVLVVVDGNASVGTWHLINLAAQLGLDYFDMWNVAITKRENYKKKFFTKASFTPVLYSGASDKYVWMHTGAQATNLLNGRF